MNKTPVTINDKSEWSLIPGQIAEDEYLDSAYEGKEEARKHRKELVPELLGKSYVKRVATTQGYKYGIVIIPRQPFHAPPRKLE